MRSAHSAFGTYAAAPTGFVLGDGVAVGWSFGARSDGVHEAMRTVVKPSRKTAAPRLVVMYPLSARGPVMAERRRRRRQRVTPSGSIVSSALGTMHDGIPRIREAHIMPLASANSVAREPILGA